jgi:hypothetical protein
MGAVIALFKYLFILGAVGSAAWAMLKEHDAKNKVIEIIVSILLLVMVFGLPPLIVKIAGPNSQKVRDVVYCWDISPIVPDF